MFCGDLGNEVNDEVLAKAFTRFPSYIMSRVRRGGGYLGGWLGLGVGGGGMKEG